MRKTFVKTLEELFDQDPKVVLFLGDIGAFLLRNIKQKHPRRFINVGISEAAMMSAAAGMALDGWKPFVYTITPFVTARCFDQIRVGVGYHHANVKIVGVGSGISYSPLGATHHSFEDTSIMRTIPGITILAPDSPSGTAKAVWQAAKIQGPVYLRLTLNLSDENRPGKSKKFKAMEVIKHGSRVILVSYGETVKECVLAAEKLEAKGIYPTVISINLIKPLSKKLISIISSSSADYIFSVEEHGIIGGLGSAISEVLAEMPRGQKPQLLRIGINDEYVEHQGHKHEVYKCLGLDAASIYRKVMQKCAVRQPSLIRT